MKKIQMVDLQGQYRKIKPEVDSTIQRILDSASFVKGPEVKDFERELAQFLGGGHVIACANGTDALQVALMALNLKPGDEVITPDFTFIATVEAIAFMGLKPVIVDVNPGDYNICIKSLKRAITKRTRV